MFPEHGHDGRALRNALLSFGILTGCGRTGAVDSVEGHSPGTAAAGDGDVVTLDGGQEATPALADDSSGLPVDAASGYDADGIAESAADDAIDAPREPQDAGDASPSVLGNGTIFPDATDFYPSEGIFLTSVKAPAPATVLALATIAKQSGGSVRMALYDDDGGAPAALLATTDVMNIVTGENHAPPVPALSTLVTDHTYWVGVYALTGPYSVDLYQKAALVDSWQIQSSGTFPDPFPSTLASFGPGPELNLFLIVQY